MQICEKNYAQIMKEQIEPFLKEKRREDFFLSFDNNKIHFEAYEQEASRATVVLLHGFTESAQKLREVSYRFLKEGYSVFAPDLRDHGKSFRTSEKPGTVNGQSFEDYAEDLRIFLERVVKPACGKKPLYIYSHSLGGTVVLLGLVNGLEAEKVVLSSPMICGNMGMPVPVAYTVAKLFCALGGKNVSAPGRCKFNPSLPFEKADGTSKARFEYYMEKRKADRLLQTNGPAFGWVRASVEARDKIFKEADKIKTPLLLIKPEEDKQLLMTYTDRFAEAVGTKPVTLEGTKHEIFSSSDKALAEYYKLIFDFLS